MDEPLISIESFRKKFEGKQLGFEEIYAAMDQISQKRFYYRGAVSHYSPKQRIVGFDKEEIYYFTKTLLDSGKKIHFTGIAADLHCLEDTVGVPVSLIAIPIVAAAGFHVPKSMINTHISAGGMADVMEVLAPVSFSKEEIKILTAKAGACIVAEAISSEDMDVLSKAESFLHSENYDKILVSTMATYILAGITHLVIDLPYGEIGKFRDLSDAESLKRKFAYLAEKLHIQTHVYVHKADEPAGRGIGPVLEARDVLRVLEQSEDRSEGLEKHALHLSGILLDLCLESSEDLKKRILKEFGSGLKWAHYILSSGHALQKMRKIVALQGGNQHVTHSQLQPGKFSLTMVSQKTQIIKKINSRNMTIIAKILGAPTHKKSGVYIYRAAGEHIEQNTPLFTLYSENEYRLQEALDSLGNFPIYE